MSKLVMIGMALSLSSPALAAGVFDGTWKGDLTSAKLPTKPTMVLLKDGMFTCSTCVPKITIPADGASHPVTGNPYRDAMTVTVVDASTVKEVTMRGGKQVGMSTTTVSPDGQSEVYTYEDTGTANGVPVTGKGMAKRVGAAPAGAHAISGSWVDTTEGAQVSDSGLTFMFMTDGDRVSFRSPTGQSYTAQVGGPVAAVAGDPGWTGVSLKRMGANAMFETDLRDGKPIGTVTMTVTPDGMTMTLVNEDKLHGTTTTVTAHKQ